MNVPESDPAAFLEDRRNPPGSDADDAQIGNFGQRDSQFIQLILTEMVILMFYRRPEKMIKLHGMKMMVIKIFILG